MSTINITDKLGLNIAATPNPSSALSKYLKDPKEILANLGTVKDIRELKISDDPFTSQSLGLSFNQPVTLGSSGVDLNIKPALQATVAISTGKPLFDAATDPFGDTVAIPPNDAFVSLAIQATLGITGSAKPAGLQFGFTNTTTVTFTNYLLFPTSDPIVPALTTLFTNFTIPGDISDVDLMLPGSIATVAGSGSLKLTAEMDLPAGVNPLATVSDTVLSGMLTLKAGGSAKITGSFTLSGGYQVRIQRLAGRKFQLEFLKQRSTELDVSVEADLSASVTAGGTDLIQTLMTMASSDPTPDKTALKQGGLTDDQIASINAAVKSGVQRSLQLSVSAELDALNQSSTAFSYAVDLDILDTDATGAARDAVNLALNGDLSGLESGTLPGVKLVRSVFQNLKQRKQILKLNVLGIFSVASLTTLVQQGSVIVDQDSGAVTITDKTTATRIGFTAANFAKDGAKLRQILAESVMITAAYRTAGALPTAQFGTTLWFFEFVQKTNLDKIRDYLNISSALGVRPPAQIGDGVNAFGQSTFNVDATYNDDQFRSLFQASGTVRQVGEYEAIGRKALMALLPGGNLTDDARRVLLSQVDLWNELKSVYEGEDATMMSFFSKYPNLKPYAGIISTDFLLVLWWSGAMGKMAIALAALLDFFNKNPGWSKDDAQFLKLHKALNKSMDGVSSNTTSDFREPLGVLAMDFASGQKAATTVHLSSPKLSFTAER
jgi:hypothetical protein